MSGFTTYAINMAHEEIVSNGGAAILRRSTGDRTCYACLVELSPIERKDLAASTPRTILVSAKNLTVPPDKDKDTLILLNTDGSEQRPLKLLAKPDTLTHANQVVYYELSCSDGRVS
jgi:hypothetical protein